MIATRGVLVGLATSGFLLAGLAFGTAPASAHGSDGTGTVVAHSGVNVRTARTTDSGIIATIPYGRRVEIACKQRGENINGNRRWYKLMDRDGWVSARFVRNNSQIQWC